MFSRILVIMSILGVTWTHTTWSNYCNAPTTGPFQTEKENFCPSPAPRPNTDNHPWTHDTHCITTPDDEYGKEGTYCLYTRSSSGSRHGFSIVTTPEIAHALSLKTSISDHDQESAHLRPNSTSPVYETRKTIGRGIGVFSTGEIQAGEVILTDSPIFISIRDALDHLQRRERQEMQWRGILQLSGDDQKLFRSLARSRGGDEIDDILQTNGIGLSLGDNRGHLAVMPKAARINHSCRPNAYYRFNETIHSLDVFALRNIKNGEEINFSYGYAEMTQEKRHEYLKTHWGFECSCNLCSAPAEIISKSDKRIKDINELKEKLSAGGTNHKRQLAIIAKLLRLFDEEGLVTPKAQYCEIATYAANQMGDEKKATSYGKLALKYWNIVAGPQSWEVQRMEELLRDPKAHPSWRPNVDKVTEKLE